MTAWVALGVERFLSMPGDRIVADLAAAQLRKNLPGTAAAHYAWLRSIAVLKSALASCVTGGWTILLEYPLLRIGRRADAVLLTPGGIFVIEFKTGETGDLRAAARQADDYAQDLYDFHAGSRSWPIVPIAVSPAGPRHPSEAVLIWHGVAPVQCVRDAALGDLLVAIAAQLPSPKIPLEASWWQDQPYRPVPGIVEAARMAFARQAVPDIDAVRAEPAGLRGTTAAILDEIETARQRREHRVIFVTGIPGAGKTRCGLAIAFEADDRDRAVFLTGNPTLVHVFREALARDAAESGVSLAVARQRMEQRIQALPAFRDHHVARGDTPDEHVIVIDEAQRSWARDHAIRKTRERIPPLTDSEPGHILDAMGRHPDWAVIVCLVGGGQEIHDGEGGLAEWGSALRARPRWRSVAADDALRTEDARQRLPADLGTAMRDDLHLRVPVRSLRGPQAAAWVDAILCGNVAEASRLAEDGTLPFVITRDLSAMRAMLRHSARGHRRAGLVASSGAKRLRAEGLGAELPHMDRNAVARWYLDRWPEDVRASDALEAPATEFCCQGLELDYVGMAWGGDLVRRGRDRWVVRRFYGTDWQDRATPEAISNGINTYRVLLTRARYETIIWIPRGSPADGPFNDRTRPAAEMDAIAEFLLDCGARRLANVVENDAAVVPPASLLL